MFSSEQIFKVSGTMEQLEMTIKFAIDMYEIEKDRITYQITEDGKYCLGWSDENLDWIDENGWNKFPFDFDPHIVAKIIEQHLTKQKCDNPYYWADGITEKGFLMKAIFQSFSDEKDGIKKPFFGIVSIEPYMNFYAN